ncbi:uncharacterized protein L201_007037 [Kwoniella dendrophila CBS 6074]|uniref:Alpha 1,6-mannosyltransferase n=1 Tax=Kwoniella dendrophila CBS 6074 TaxID=1295534 RepID=A0AAX4K5R1_9TREE
MFSDSSSSSSKVNSRRSSSEQSTTSTAFSPIISNSQTFKKSHSRNSSTSKSTSIPKLSNLSHSIIGHDHNDIEKGYIDNSHEHDYGPSTPSLENVNNPLHNSINKHIPIPHPHLGLRRRRLLSQFLIIFGVLTLLGWYILNEREDGLISSVIGKTKPIKTSWRDDIDDDEPILPGIVIGSNGQVTSSNSGSSDSDSTTKPVEEEGKVLSHAEKMAELSRIKGPEWGLNLSSEKLLAGLRKWPDKFSKDNEEEEALSSLGHFADYIYDLGPLDLNNYIDQLKEFSSIVFPKTISENLLNGIKTYLGNSSPWLTNKDQSLGLGEKENWDSNKKIWQTDKYTLSQNKLQSKEIKSWKDGNAQNEGWDWDLLTDIDADKYVNKKLSGSRFKVIWDNLPSGILRSDTLRYLLILLEGGIYSDTDTTLLKSPSEWGKNPKLFHDGIGWLSDSQSERIKKNNEDVDDVLGKPSIIVGLEADVGDREDWFDWWPRPIQIVQWTITAAPFHPIALNALLRIHHATAKAVEWSHSVNHSIKVLKDQGRYEDAKALSKVDVLNEPKNGGPVGVMAWTGPGIWTDAVLSYLRVKYGLVWTDLKDLREPLRVGDVVVLPVTGFSPGVGNFGAQMSSHHQAMVEHAFAGSWKEDSK